LPTFGRPATATKPLLKDGPAGDVIRAPGRLQNVARSTGTPPT
jgi:hypothetical protein